jgi:hypothetical protein
MSETSFKISCSASASARRLSLSKPTLADLRSHVEASWGASGPSFWYNDDDGSRISVETDRGLDAAVAAMRACVALNVDFDSVATLLDASHSACVSTPSSPRQSSDEAEHSFFIVESNSEASVKPEQIVADTQEPSEQVAAELDVVGAQPQNQERLEQHVDPKGMQPTVRSAPLELPREVMAVDQSSGENALVFENLQLKQEIRQLEERNRSDIARVLQAADEKYDATTSVLKKQLHECQAKLSAAEMRPVQASQLQEIHAMRSEIENLRAQLNAALSQAEQEKCTSHDLAVENATVKQKMQLSENAMELMRIQVAHAEDAAVKAVHDSAELGRLRAEAEKYCIEASNSSRDRDRLAAECESMRQELFQAKESSRQLQDQIRQLSEELHAVQKRAIEKSERLSSALQCMSLDTVDDAVRCIIINNGDVPNCVPTPTMVDQMLAMPATAEPKAAPENMPVAPVTHEVTPVADPVAAVKAARAEAFAAAKAFVQQLAARNACP